MVCLGRVVVAHGVQGWVGIETYTERAEEIAAYGDLTDEAGETTYTLAAMRMGPKGLLALFEGVDDRDAAEDLKGTRLYVPRSALPRIRDKDAYYHADLIGVAAVLIDGTALGTVTAVQNFGAGDLLEIVVPGKRDTVLVPFTKAIVPEVDMKARRLVVDPPPGLLDDSKPEEPPEEGDDA